ncbi:hypothetical protein BGZ93_001152 [Podila epicladia]|nr:hypothetical protein BGZ92_002454 [Podila epicladia]KAG0084607.1 hypothetical protein BGZ93_001152 [Podila epicladia]
MESEESGLEEVEDEPLTDSRCTRRETRASVRAKSGGRHEQVKEQDSQYGSEEQESKEPEFSIKESALDSSAESLPVFAEKKHEASLDIDKDLEDEFDPEREDMAGGSGGESSTMDAEDTTTGAPKHWPGRPRGSTAQ